MLRGRKRQERERRHFRAARGEGRARGDDRWQYFEGSPATEARIDALIAAYNKAEAARAAGHAEQYHQAGSVWIAKPAPVEEPPALPAGPVVELDETWAGHASTLTRSEHIARSRGFTSYNAVVAMMAGLQGHERVPRGADAETRVELADRAHDVLVQRCGGNVEQAEEIIAAWHQAVSALGWGNLVAAQGVDMSADLIEFTGRRWLADTRGRQ